MIGIGLSQLQTYLAMVIVGNMQLFPDHLMGEHPLVTPKNKYGVYIAVS